jgi:hypothetical protein
MKLISHRGNISGIDINKENNPQQIIKVLELEMECEIDVWYKNNAYFLGHDRPQYQVGEEFLENPALWCHAKNIEALVKMKENKYIHCFWHENDKVTLTSRGYIWSFPSEIPINNSIIVLPEKYNTNISKSIGICSDFILKYIT